MGYRHVVGALLAVTLCSGIARAESSARVQIEEFFRRATAILSEDPDVDRARDDVRGLAHALFDGRRAVRSALGTAWGDRGYGYLPYDYLDAYLLRMLGMERSMPPGFHPFTGQRIGRPHFCAPGPQNSQITI